MKAQILKIAGVKSEKEFYKKFPTEEAFMKKHGKELKKAKNGIPIAGLPGMTFDDISGINKIINTNNTLGMGITALPEIISGVSGIIEDKKTLDKSKKYAKLAELAASVPQEKLPQRQYVRPEDYLVEDFNKYGVAQNGASIGGNPTEIQNMYNPGDMYSDLAYEPLNDSNPKQYQLGGNVDYGQLAPLLGNFASGVGSYGGGGGFRQGNYGKTASAIGGLAGSFFGPVGSMVGSTAGGLIGGAFDADALAQQQAIDEKRDAFLGSAAFGNTRKQQFGAYTKNGGTVPSYEDGGWVSNDWMPQTITKFGDYNMKELLAPPHDADMLRAGGHLKEYTPPSARAMYTGRDLPYQMEYGGQMAMGGELQTLWGGGLETISRNPYDDSEIVMPKGQSHDESDSKGRSGIGLRYGNGGMSDHAEYGANDQDASVEVEKNEPMVKMADGGNADNLVVFGNMIEDESKKKYKVLAKEIAEDNAKQNKIKAKAAMNASEDDDDTVFGQFRQNTNLAQIIGPDMKLQQNSLKLKDYAAKQNAILDTAKEFKIDADALAKGKIKPIKPNDPYAAEFGAKLEQFKPGGKKGKKKTNAIEFPAFDNTALMQQFIPETRSASTLSGLPVVSPRDLPQYDVRVALMPDAYSPVTGIIPTAFPLETGIQSNVMENQQYGNEDPINTAKRLKDNKTVNTTNTSVTKNTEETPDWWNAITSVMPYLRPTNQKPLDPAQLAEEMYAMATNTKQPVFAQTFTPDLTQPSRISLQDQVNKITSQANASKRLVGNNPAALASIDAELKKSIGEIMGEQFRMNQGEQQRAMETNRQTMNDARLKNLGIRQEQADKMAAVDANTRKENQAILSSLAAKTLQNKAENQQLAIAENMYNYRFDPQGRAYNVNAPYNFNIPNIGYGASSINEIGNGRTAKELRALADLQEEAIAKKTTKSTTGKNGAIVKAIKNL